MAKTLKWGILGTAGIARSQTIPGMKEAENCELYAIAGRDLAKAQAFADEFGFEKAYGSYEELLEDPDVEALYIPLPNHMHCEWVIRALDKKIPVLCEKPMGLTEEEDRAMFEAAERNGVPLMEAFAYLQSPYMEALKNEIASGAIGEIVYIESAFVEPEHEAENIRMRRDTMGGCLYDLGCYNTSFILTLMGREPKSVQAVSTFSEQGVDIYTAALLDFGKPAAPSAASNSGAAKGTDTPAVTRHAFAEFNCGMMLGVEGTDRFDRIDRISIRGTKGWIESKTRFNQPGDCYYTLCNDEGLQEKCVTARQNYGLEIEQFGRVITEGESPCVTKEFSLMNARLIDRVHKVTGY